MLHASPMDTPRAQRAADGRAPDLVKIRNLRAWSLIGVHDHERVQRQELRIDVWIEADQRAAAASDDIARAVDYSAVARAFREHAGKSTHQLIETLAEELAQVALGEFGAEAVRISIEKPGAVPGTDSVGVEIERRAEAR
ncbi:MAG: dihydroneopterin aldolase [Planctomycetota bacterium]